MSVLSILSVLKLVGPVTAAIPEFKNLWDRAVSTFGEQDQATLKQAYIDLMDQTDEGNARLKEKLEQAAKDL